MPEESVEAIYCKSSALKILSMILLTSSMSQGELSVLESFDKISKGSKITKKIIQKNKKNIWKLVALKSKSH